MGTNELNSKYSIELAFHRRMILTKKIFLVSVVYIPFFTIIEFIGYIGWIKVAETLLNPWGDDDEDFQINYLIDRNFQVGKVNE